MSHFRVAVICLHAACTELTSPAGVSVITALTLRSPTLPEPRWAAAVHIVEHIRWRTPPPTAANTSPLDGYQHFGEVVVDGRSGELTVHLRDGRGGALWSTTLRPERR